jgi:alkanesulfonate monooxygenase SsuD/methylene tetrahydromethanopterin reductase-like flavin-dependent oxidoreductase (luciferase family)
LSGFPLRSDPSDALLQSIDLAVAAEELGADGAYFRVHHFARQLSSPFPLLAEIGAKTSVSLSAAVSSRWLMTVTGLFRTRNQTVDQIGFIDENTWAIFGRSYAAEPDKLVKELRADKAIAEADTLLLTMPNQLGVDYNAHVIGAILTQIAPALDWR